MHSLPLLFIIGFVGALLFTLLKLPGGAMTGAMVSVVAFTALSGLPPAKTPSWLTFIVYTSVGVIIGSMYKPGMLQAIGAAWPTLLLSTGLILLAGCGCAWIVARSGALSIHSAYLATSPGGFNAIMGFSLTNDEAPVIMIYHLLRIYMIILLAPHIGRLLGVFLKWGRALYPTCGAAKLLPSSMVGLFWTSFSPVLAFGGAALFVGLGCLGCAIWQKGMALALFLRFCVQSA